MPSARTLSGPMVLLAAVILATTAAALPQPQMAEERNTPTSPSLRACGITSLQDLKWSLRGEKLAPDTARAMSVPEVSLTDLQEAAAKEGIALSSVSMRWDDLADLGVPVIAHFESGERRHFSLIEVGYGWVRFPGVEGVRVLPFHEAEPHYTGHTLVETSALHRELASPLVFLPTSLADLGGVQAGRLLTRSFPLHNMTGQMVKITDVICSEDCQATVWPNRDLPPSSIAWLTVTWRPKPDPSQTDQQRHFLLVTDHPARRIYICSLLASVMGTPETISPTRPGAKTPEKAVDDKS